MDQSEFWIRKELCFLYLTWSSVDTLLPSGFVEQTSTEMSILSDLVHPSCKRNTWASFTVEERQQEDTSDLIHTQRQVSCAHSA